MNSEALVSTRIEGDIGIIITQNPPVNAITRSVRAAFIERFSVLERHKSIKKVIIVCEGKTFFSGGDISEFDGEPAEPHLPDLVKMIEDSRLITVAAIHGNCFGGGFEIALGCDYRIAHKNAKFAFPEVHLGLIPGAGGSQRLPRLIGLEKACVMLASGRSSVARQMQIEGAIDSIVRAPLLEAALGYASKITKKATEKISARKVVAADITDIQRKYHGKSNAPSLNVNAACWTLQYEFSEGQAKERALHLKLRQSTQSKALRHVFFSERKVMRPAEIKGVTAQPLQKIAVIGGGLMGAGIAANALMAAKTVMLVEQNKEAAESAFERVKQILISAQKRGKLSAPLEKILGAFSYRKDMGALFETDLIIEAVFEDLNTKCKVFATAVKHCRNNTILTSNTSYLDPEKIIPSEVHDRAAGLHFFSPAQIMKLTEVVKLQNTSAQTLASLFAFARELGKVPVLCGICDGFIGNRMLAAYRRQADYMLVDGALPHEVDAAMRDFGMPMGPYEAQDMVGLQIAWANRKRQARSREPKERYVSIADELCETERFGQRSGGGWYDYVDGKRIESDAVNKLIKSYSERLTIKRQHFSARDIQDRLLAAMANEGFLIVEEGVARTNADVDIVKIAGYGFPRWLGGPLYYASQNIEMIKRAIDQVRAQSPHSWHLAGKLK